MKIKRVEHIAIAVDSLRPSIDLLKNTSVRRTSNCSKVRARTPGCPGLFHICFEVEDISAALAELKQKGVKLRDETRRVGHGAH